MIISIHTHTGPALVYHEGCGEVDPAYAQTVAPALARAARRALDDLAPVSALWFTMSPLGGPYVYNRACAEGPVDDQVRAFHIRREGAAPIELLSYACHPVCNGRSSLVSADYPGQVCRLVEEKGRRALFLNGLCGDIDPAPCGEAERPERLLAFARAIAAAAQEPAQALPLTVSGGRLESELKLTPVNREDIQRMAERQALAALSGGPLYGDQVARIWEEEMLARFDSLPQREKISVAYLRLGGVPVVALPFEGFTAIGQLIRRELQDPRALALGCAEELLGYLPTRDDMERGSYAALESTFLYKRLPPEAGEAERLGKELGNRLRRA